MNDYARSLIEGCSAVTVGVPALGGCGLPSILQAIQVYAYLSIFYYFTNIFDKAVLLLIINQNPVTSTFNIKTFFNVNIPLVYFLFYYNASF